MGWLAAVLVVLDVSVLFSGCCYFGFAGDFLVVCVCVG